MKRQYAIVFALGVTMFMLGFALPRAGAGNEMPADKVAASGSALAVMSAPLANGSSSKVATLLSARMRTSAPEDLVFAVTAECALLTDVTNVGNSDSSSWGQIKIWVELDGVPIAVGTDDTGADAGKVVFCNRAYREVVTNLDDQDARFDHYIHTRTADAFNWITLNVGSGIHDIVVKAQLEIAVNGAGNAEALVGKRTLVVDPTKLAENAVIGG